jgi:surfeit locus 1 family protein
MRFTLPNWVLLPGLVLAVAVLLGLGWWQWSRHLDAQALERQYDERLALPPQPIATTSDTEGVDLDFRRVTVVGTWDPEHALTIVSRVRDSQLGEELVEPLLLADGSAVLVDRGWYPLEARDEVRATLLADTSGNVAGLARLETGHARQNTEGGWSGFDVASMGATLPYPVAPWAVLAGEESTGDSATGPYPQTGWERYATQIPHVQYALTWWGLAAAFIAMAVVRARSRGGAGASSGSDASSAL